MQITTDAINQFFGIKESFELPNILLEKLLDKQEKDKLCRDFMRFDFDKSNDCLRDYFQSTSASRSDLKQDYTPDCICKLIAEIVPETESIVDICSGTGALTININRGISYQCEEISQMSLPILLFNLALRNLNATVLQKNVLLNTVEKIYRLTESEEFSDIVIIENYEQKKTNVVISNPPYSLKWEPKQDKRFDGYDLAPAKASDYAFVLDGLSRLTENGMAFYILPAGVLFRGGAEGKIRQELIENNLIDCVISLPEKLFLNTSIPVNILIFNKAKKTNDILIINAEKLFEKCSKQNVMTAEHIKKISEIYHNRKNVEKLSRVVTISEIKENDYNLNIPRYVCNFEKDILPSLSEITSELLENEIAINKAQNELIEMLTDLCGDDEYNELKKQFVEYFTSQNIVDKTMSEYIRLKQLEQEVEQITTHAKKERVHIFDIATFERVKKDKVYEAGTVYIQLSATDGKIKYLCENGELDCKYGVFVPKSKSIGTRYLYYILHYEMEEFLAKYQSGMNINPDIFKFLQVTYYPEYKYQQRLVMALDGIDSQYNQAFDYKSKWEAFKKYHLENMFPVC